MHSNLFTVEQVAEILMIRRTTIHSKKWQERTGCSFKKIGKRNYIEAEQFWKWFRSN